MGDVVTTTAGRVQGTEAGGVRVFRAVPYAAAPIGVRRWQAPERMVAWPFVWRATGNAPAPPQPTDASPGSGVLPGLGVTKTDEDCLYLNVWAPAGARSAPVMVWIPGGAFVTGSASIPMYDGAALAARQGVVVVTVTYRVGALGFAAIKGVPPNRGLLDQVAALAWVRDNVEAFGGDPGNVTVFGESAGGGSVLHLLAMPSARGLIRRAIVQSGATDLTLTVDQAATVVDRFLAALDGDLSAKVGAVLDAQQAAMFDSMADVGAMPFHPCVDGDVITARPLDAIATAGVDLLIGTTRDEMRMFLDPRPLERDQVIRRAGRYLASLGGDDSSAEALVAAYDDDPHLPTPGDVWSAIQTDGEMRRPADAIATAHVNAAPTFVYRFDQPLTGGLAHFRACHASDLPYPFGTIEHAGWSDVVTPDAARVSDAMQAAWAAFARTGDPSSDGLGEWPAYDTTRRQTMIIDSAPRVENDPDGHRREVWQRIAPLRRGTAP
ncbi:MAG: carboxylesterase/lipase family protein [Actinobacteria bacterium]|nr:carboxylesterase/lipase family protein [Actinomycetota bacterium]